MDIKERLLEFIKYLHWNDARFEREVGLANGFLKKTNANMRKSSIELILKRFPQLSEDWLVNGNGDMLKAPVQGGNFVGNNNHGIDNSYIKQGNSDALIQALLDQQQITKTCQEQLTLALKQIEKLTALIAKGGNE